MTGKATLRFKVVTWSSIFVLGVSVVSLAQNGGGTVNPFYVGVGCGVWASDSNNPFACAACCGQAILDGAMDPSETARQACIETCALTYALLHPIVEQ